MFLKEYEDHFLKSNKQLVYNEEIGLSTTDIQSDILHVFIAGIGMHAKTFAMPFNAIKDNRQRHLLALTLKGFGENDKGIEYDEKEQVKLASKQILKFAKKNQVRNISLFGFSYGADLLVEIAMQIINDARSTNMKIAINRMVCSEVNIDESTAFITGKIAEIEKLYKNDSDEKKKGILIEQMLARKSTKTEVLNNLEYLRSSYLVSWPQMAKSAKSAFKECRNRIKRIVDFCETYKHTKVWIYLREDIYDLDATKPDNLTIQPKLESHFDGISLILIIEADKFMMRRSSVYN